MAKRTRPTGLNAGLGFFRNYPAGVSLLVVITTVLGWLGCDSLSQVADRTADLLNNVPAGNGTATAPLGLPWGTTAHSQSSTQISGSQSAYPATPASYPSNAGGIQATPISQPEPFVSIGSFNIQVFGTSKMNDANLMGYLVDIARKFDVLAIQELRSTDDTIVPRFVQMINQGGFQYGYVVGPREGRTDSKEQYIYIFNEQKIERIDKGIVLRHPQRLLHRDPLAVTFRCRTPDPRNGFTFTLINIHTDPDLVPTEMGALADILRMARQAFPYEDDLILLGDLNASPLQFGPLAQIPNLFAIIPPEMNTNTMRSKCYDNIVFDRYATNEFQNKFGVFDLAQFYGLKLEQAQLISDHLPIWGLFSAYEKPQAGLASQPTGFR